MTGRLVRDAPFCSVRGQQGIRKGFISCSSTVARKAGSYHPSPRLRQRRGAGVQQPRPVLFPIFTRVRRRVILRISAVVSSSRKPAPAVVVLGGGSLGSQAPYLLYDSRRR